MSNYTIECKNLTAIENLPPDFKDGQVNGLWTTNIQQHIVLEENDSVVMSSCFVDTRATAAQKIVIEDDLDLDMDFLYYLINTSAIPTQYMECFTGFTQPPPADFIPDNPQNDGRLYLATVSHPENVNAAVLNDLPFCPVDSDEGQPFGGFTIFIKFTNLLGDEETKKFILPRKTRNGGSGQVEFLRNVDIIFNDTLPVTITAATENGTELAPTPGTFANTQFGNQKNQASSFPNSFRTRIGENEFTGAKFKRAFIGNKKISIEANNYDPHDLCEVLNRELNKVGADVTSTNLTDNKFLIPELQGNNAKLQFVSPVDNLDVTGDANTAAVDLGFEFTATASSTPPATPAITGFQIGASQVTISFDDSTQKFFWEYTFTPYYLGAVEAVGYFEGKANTSISSNPSTKTTFNTVTSHSGILWKDLRAFKKGTNEPVDFWSGSLGFDLDYNKRDKTGNPTGEVNPDCILVQYSPQLNIKIDQGRQPYVKPVFNPPLNIGVTLSGKYQGIDTSIEKQKNATDTPEFPYIPVLAAEGGTNNTSPTNYLLSSSDKTSPIEAKNSVLGVADNVDFAYFLIEVQAQFQNNFITPNNNMEQIVAVVGRFYTKDSYVAGSEGDSIIYTHKGEPQLLSSFRCRILDSNKNIVPNIGDDSTIFMQVIKAPKQIEDNKKTK